MTGRFIAAEAGAALDALVSRLTAAASRLGKTRARSRDLSRRSDETRWRRAELVWPLFPKG